MEHENIISIELVGNPIPQKRPRFSRQGNFVRCYDSQLKYKESYQFRIKSQFRENMLNGPLSLDIIFFMPIPKSASKREKTKMVEGIVFHTKKPDLDNLLKFAIDSLSKIVFGDDRQIVDICARKIYSRHPATMIQVIPIKDEKRRLFYENITHVHDSAI